MAKVEGGENIEAHHPRMICGYPSHRSEYISRDKLPHHCAINYHSHKNEDEVSLCQYAERTAEKVEEARRRRWRQEGEAAELRRMLTPEERLDLYIMVSEQFYSGQSTLDELSERFLVCNGTIKYWLQRAAEGLQRKLFVEAETSRRKLALATGFAAGLPSYEIPEADSDLWNCGVNLSLEEDEK